MSQRRARTLTVCICTYTYATTNIIIDAVGHLS